MSTGTDAPAPMIGVEFARVEDGIVRRDTLRVPSGSTLAQAVGYAVEASLLPSDVLEHCVAAIFGKARAPDHPVREADRIELLGELLVDPKLSRQRRVQVRRQAAARDMWRGQK